MQAMRLRLAWLSDGIWEDCYGAREARLLLRAIARTPGVVPLWFAVGYSGAPIVWHGVRVFPMGGNGTSGEFTTRLRTLVSQQQPDILVSSLRQPALLSAIAILGSNCLSMRRVLPGGSTALQPNFPGGILVGDESVCSSSTSSWFVPYIKGIHPGTRGGADVTNTLDMLRGVLLSVRAKMPVKRVSRDTHVIMRHHVFCSSSVGQAMFQLTNALLELGVSAIPQDEFLFLRRDFFKCEEDLYRVGAPLKYERFNKVLNSPFDPEHSIIVHFSLLRGSTESECGVFRSLNGREVIYVTGNHTVSGDTVSELARRFEILLAPSEHVLRPYTGAGWNRFRSGVVPHGIDPSVFYPKCPSIVFPTNKRFKFLQTSFPWITEKGFDLTVKAFCQAFSCDDDVSLVLRVPCVESARARHNSVDRLQSLVNEAMRVRRAPEIVLIEEDLPFNKRGSVYTSADCYVHPLRAEGFGMTILEAMACGLPVIATNWSGPADFLSPLWSYAIRHSGLFSERSPGGNALRFHVEPDLGHLTYLMRYVYENQSEAKALGLRAARIAHNNWTWTHAAIKLTSALQLETTNQNKSDVLGQMSSDEWLFDVKGGQNGT